MPELLWKEQHCLHNHNFVRGDGFGLGIGFNNHGRLFRIPVALSHFSSYKVYKVIYHTSSIQDSNPVI